MTAMTPGAFDPALVSAVQSSFAQVQAASGDVGRHFYDRLFREAPEVRPLFRGDADRQATKLIDTINVVVAALGHFDAVLPIARDLARRHVAYGVTPQHYAIVGRVLISTLAEVLGRHAFTPFTRDAWERTYAALAAVMIAAAYDDAPV